MSSFALNNKYKNSFVRDLAWVVASPCSIENPAVPEAKFFANEYKKFELQLFQLDAQPQKLEEFLGTSKRHALGNYFEDLVEFWLCHRHNTKLLARGLQIQDGNTTIGECDFIIELDGVVTHLEVSIKYYLALSNSNAHSNWVGRDLSDRLDIKLEKMFSHQLELSSSSAAETVFAELHLPKIKQKMGIFKGYFFEHYFTQPHAQPLHASSLNKRAFWCRASEVEALPESMQNWQILHKPHWLTFDDEFFERMQLLGKVESYFHNIKHTPVLCNCLINKEPVKFFIAPDNWAKNASY